VLAFAGEKGLQKEAGARFVDAAVDFRTMVARRLIVELRAMFDGAALRIGGSEIQPANACEGNGGSAHGARLERHVEIAAREPLAFSKPAALSDDEHLGMGGRVSKLSRSVAGRGNRLSNLVDQDSADRNLSAPAGRRGLFERARHMAILENGCHKRSLELKMGRYQMARTPARQDLSGTNERDGGDRPSRIAKVIARSGLCSRRQAEVMISAGRVTVNGRTEHSPALNIASGDVIAVDGRILESAKSVRLWRYHKPKGLMTTHRDPEGRPTVFASLPAGMPRVISVGRLDFNTEGLLLLTNDGGLARHLELPATGWLRRYRVRAHGSVSEERLALLAKGLVIDGVRYEPIEARLERQQGGNVWLSIGIREGRNREVRKVLASLDLLVNRLIRVSFGPFQLADLAPGAVVEVERRVLREQLGPAVARQFGLTGRAPEISKP
jgi:23S rRNA pseudouridine2605 synthase